MNFVHTLTRMLVTYLLRVFLILLPLFVALAAIVGSPAYLEAALHKSGVYDHFVEAVMVQSAKQTKDTDTQNLLNDPGVRNIVGQSITPQILQHATEEILDGFYAWVTGKTSDIQFTIDLTEAQQKLQSNLKTYALARAQSLPTCNVEQLKTLSSGPSQDILHVPCLPPGLNAQQAAEQFSKDTLSGADFLTNTKITSADLQKSTSGESFTTQNNWIPAVYHWITVAPWAIGTMGLLATIGVFFVCGKGRRALKAIGWSFLGVGIFWIVTVGLYALAAQRLAETMPSTNTGVLDGPLLNALLHLLHEVMVRIGIVSGVYGAIGIGVLIIMKQYYPDQPAAVTPTANTAASTAQSEQSVEPSKEEQNNENRHIRIRRRS